MAFKPAKTGGGNGGGDYEFVNVEPKAGNRLARVSLIVDMGTQEREDYVDEKTGETKPQKPCQQVAVFADLVNDVVEYPKIGKAQYRMLLNKSFAGAIAGTNFTTVPPKDASGKLMQGKPWTLHPANLLTKLAKATGHPEVIVDNDKPGSLDIERLLNEPFLCNVEVKKTPAKGDKKDKDGNPIVYTNVNFNGASPVPPSVNAEGDEVETVVKELTQKARCVTFENATKEDIQFIRPGLRKQIKAALNYAGSKMQAAIEAFEAEQSNGDDAGGDDQGDDTPAQEEKPAAKPAAKKTAAAAKKAAAAKPAADADDEDVPF